MVRNLFFKFIDSSTYSSQYGQDGFLLTHGDIRKNIEIALIDFKINKVILIEISDI